MTMHSISTSNSVYMNSRNHWQTINDHLPYGKEAINKFHEWLSAQGATVCTRNRPNMPVIVDSVGIATEIDTLVFENEHDKLTFLLRWK